MYKCIYIIILSFMFFKFMHSSQSSERCVINLETIFSVVQIPAINRSKVPPGFLETRDLILKNGFGYEKHRVITDDGYVLTVHRIVTNNSGGPPVLFQHGFILSSDGWLLTGRKSDLAFQLADAGYDVWLSDRRGNWYSREHVKYKPTSPQFWNFSFHESALYDLSAVIDYIVDVTNYPKVIFFGHSMGCTEFFVLTSMRPEYNEKVKLAALYGPIAILPSVQDLSPMLRLIMITADSIYRTFYSSGRYEFSPRNIITVETMRKCCQPSNVQPICLDVFAMLFGDHRTNFNMTLFGFMVSHWPSGGSIKTANHMAQIYKSDFGLYDYGPNGNLIRYKNITRPLYPLNRVTAPVALYWGANDAFLNEQAMNKLESMLPNVIENYKVPDPKFNHMDFIWGLNTKDILNQRIIKLINNIT